MERNKQQMRGKNIFLLFSALGSRKNKKDKCVEMWHEQQGFLFIGTHVDDLFVLYNKKGKAERQSSSRKRRDLVRFRHKDRERLKLSQTQYTENLLRIRFDR